jgi:hypothetical protein
MAAAAALPLGEASKAAMQDHPGLDPEMLQPAHPFRTTVVDSGPSRLQKVPGRAGDY